MMSRPPIGPRRGRARAHGLTLLEIAIVLAVLAILGTLALPSMGARLQRQRLQFAAETLAGDIAEARLLAAQRGVTMHVQAQQGTDWCWAVSSTPGCPCGEAAQACQLRRVGVDRHPGIRLVQGPDLTLSADGTATLTQAALFESSGGQRVQVAVTTLGRPRLCTPTGHWPQMPDC